MSSSSRNKLPPVNLKERIAALQQKNELSSHQQRPTSPAFASPANVGQQTIGALREKIAKFESKGGVPVPRGSFGLGAPPPSENGQAKRRGELYGNRIPAPIRPQVTGGSIGRSASPLQFSRRTSLSGVDFDDYTDVSLPGSVVGSPRLEASFRSLSPPPPLPELPDGIQNFGLPKVIDTGRRGTQFATAMDIARKAEAESQSVYDPRSREGSMSPSPPPIVANRRFSTLLDATPSPVIVVEEPEAAEDDLFDAAVDSAEPEFVVEESGSSEVDVPQVKQDTSAESDHAVGSVDVQPSEQTNHLDSPPSSPPVSSEVIHENVIEDAPVESTEDSAVSVLAQPKDDFVTPPVAVAVTSPPATSEPAVGASGSGIHNDPAEVPLEATKPQADDLEAPSATASPVVDTPPQTPAEEPHDEHHINVQGSSPDTLSTNNSLPQVSSPASSLARLAYDEPDAETKRSLEYEAAGMASAAAVEDDNLFTPPIRTSSLSQNSFMSQSSMGESSPGYLETAHRISPISGRAIFIPPRPSGAPESPATPSSGHVPFPVPHPSNSQSPDTSEFGMVTLGHGQSNRASTFSAVVHSKVRDVPAYGSFTLPRAAKNVPETPQASRGKGGSAEPPTSPGFGDLAMLMAQATLLEQKLMDGDLPSERSKDHIVPPAPKTAPPEIREHPMPPREPPPPEQQRHVRKRSNSTKSGKERISEESSRKPRLSIRNPLSRSKSANQKDPMPRISSESTPQLPETKDVGRAKSMYLTSSSQPSLSLPPVPSVREPPPPVPSLTTSKTYSDDVPPTPPPKSPRKYLSGFKRLASSSRSHGAYPRHSVSTSSEISSEDSVAVVTPPDNSPDFISSGTLLETRTRTRSGSRSGAYVVGTGVAWPREGSPKKSGGSMSRAASFAEKMFQRRRTKSGASVASSVESTDRLAVQSVFEPLPSIPSAVLPPSPSVHDFVIPSIEQPELYPTPEIPPPTNPSFDGPDPSNLHVTPPRPTSWMSTSSTGSAPLSPLFDKEIFDAFPSVPQTMPSSLARELPLGHGRTSSQATLSRHFSAVVGPGHPQIQVQEAFTTVTAPVPLSRHSTKRSYKGSASLNHNSTETRRQIPAVP